MIRSAAGPTLATLWALWRALSTAQGGPPLAWVGQWIEAATIRWWLIRSSKAKAMLTARACLELRQRPVRIAWAFQVTPDPATARRRPVRQTIALVCSALGL